MSLKDQIKILVVDDMSVSRGLLEQALEGVGIKNIGYATNGHDALEAIAKSPVHMVISDYNMPKMDGLHLLSALRKNPSTQKVGFILVTGSEDSNVIAHGQKLGMNNYLKKPFTTESLKACIERVTGPL